MTPSHDNAPPPSGVTDGRHTVRDASATDRTPAVAAAVASSWSQSTDRCGAIKHGLKTRRSGLSTCQHTTQHTTSLTGQRSAASCSQQLMLTITATGADPRMCILYNLSGYPSNRRATVGAEGRPNTAAQTAIKAELCFSDGPRLGISR